MAKWVNLEPRRQGYRKLPCLVDVRVDRPILTCTTHPLQNVWQIYTSQEHLNTAEDVVLSLTMAN